MRRSGLIGGAIALLALIFVPLANANVLKVTSTADSGSGSLRQVISEATGGDTIDVPAGTYDLATALDVGKSLTFLGAGARVTTLNGQGKTGIFELNSPAAGVTIDGMTLTGGSAADGGAIYSTVPLTLEGDAVTGNTASSEGGGVYDAALLTLTRSLIAGNSAPHGDGGGIELAVPTSGTLSTISDSTVAENSALGTGGGIDESNSSEYTLELLGDTVVGNTLSESGSQGGNFRAWSNTTIEFRNTYFAGGQATSGGNCYYGGGAHVISLGHNAQDVEDSECEFKEASGDHNNVAALLGPLQDNGGPTDTLLPATNSPLLNAGDSEHCSLTDQRGVPRPQGGGCDIGAVERAKPTTGAASVVNITPIGASVLAEVNPFELGGSVSVAYGTTPAYGSLSAAQTLPEATLSQTVAVSLTSLAPSTTYHLQLRLTTPDGTTVSPDATFTTAATGLAPPPPPGPMPVAVKCIVPRLHGLSLGKAKTALVKAHCALGSVKQPKHLSRAQKKRLVVLAQSPAAAKTLPAGTSVALTLGVPRPKPKHKPKHK
jgi:hypothetical protein